MQPGSTERILGWLSLLVGTILVVSVTWVAVGFLSLSLGLIFLQIAERKRKLSRASSSPDVSVDVFLSPQTIHGRQIDAGAVPHFRSETDIARPPPNGDVWPILTELDPDIKKLAVALAPYGQRYVDQLAAECLDAADATQFPEIGRKIVAAALEGLDRARKVEEKANDHAERLVSSIRAGATKDKLASQRSAPPLVQNGPTYTDKSGAETEPSVASGPGTVKNEAAAEQRDVGVVRAVELKPVSVMRQDRPPIREISNEERPNMGSSHESAGRVQGGPEDDDDLKDMAKILDRLNDVLTTKR